MIYVYLHLDELIFYFILSKQLIKFHVKCQVLLVVHQVVNSYNYLIFCYDHQVILILWLWNPFRLVWWYWLETWECAPPQGLGFDFQWCQFRWLIYLLQKKVSNYEIKYDIIVILYI